MHLLVRFKCESVPQHPMLECCKVARWKELCQKRSAIPEGQWDGGRDTSHVSCTF